MKPVFQFTASVLMLGGLLFQVTSHATNLAEQPLKASVLAKPNVVFAMDNSGSMDAEVLLKTYQGWYWNSTSNTTLYPSDALRVTNSGTTPYAYLFPNGVPTPSTAADDGTKIPTQANGSNAGHAIPPINELAWARSSDYNPIYYDTTKTYKPWAPGYTTISHTFLDAAPLLARSHPVIGTATMNLTANIAATAYEWQFAFMPGMRMPSNATNITSGCSGGSPGNVVTGGKCYATVPYYPATFWRKETCTVNTTDCVRAYDLATIKRYEIKAGNTFPSGRTYAAEMQNFANWFQYYRKRKLLMAGAMGEVLENMTGLRMGVVAFTPNAAPTMYDTDASSAASNGRRVAGTFYSATMGGSTPTRGTFKYIYDQFDTNTNIIQYACQRNAAFIITDGFANDGQPTIPSYSTTYGNTAPYTTLRTGWLNDQALAYFSRRLRATTGVLPAGQVPLGSQTVTNPDPNPDLHMNTYAVTLGMRGDIWPANSNAFASPPNWPTPVADSASMIDDLWHATINGRGQMYLATDVESAVVGITAALFDIKSQEGAQSSVAVSTYNLLASDGKAYEASYNPAGWIGDLTASTINMTTGAISNTPTWSASSLLLARDWSTRVVITSNALGQGQGFTNANVGALVNPDVVAYPDSADVVNYLRGKRTGEGTRFRTRTGLMGAVINAEPAIDSTGMAYVASGEGMLHAVNTLTGAEEWAYVPFGALSSIGQTVQREYAFKTKLDGTPSIGKYTDAGAKLLVAGMGAAGRSYYALDVSNPKSLTESQAAAQVKWTFPSSTQVAHQANLGYTVGKPVIVKTANDGYVVLVTSGYDNGATIGDGKGRVWMLNANTGAVIRTFVTTAGSTGAEAGLTQLGAYREDTGTARYAYGGDLLGNLWKFDLDTGTTTLVTTLRDAGGNAQPVTTAPQLTRIQGKPVIMVATGRLLDISDFGNSNVQSVYAVVDTGSGTVARSDMNALTHNTGTRVISGTVDWVAKKGWYVDLPAGEHVNVDPKFALGWLYVNANSAGGANCAQGASGYRIFVRTGAGASESLSTTANVTSPVLVQLSEGALVRWTRNNAGDIKPDKFILTKTYDQRRNAWRDSR